MPETADFGLATVVDETHTVIAADVDVLAARFHGRALAVTAGFSGSDLTVIATAISEVARNIVSYAGRGEILISVIADGDRRGISVVARDSGPGIPDIERLCEMATRPDIA